MLADGPTLDFMFTLLDEMTVENNLKIINIVIDENFNFKDSLL